MRVTQNFLCWVYISELYYLMITEVNRKFNSSVTYSNFQIINLASAKAIYYKHEI